MDKQKEQDNFRVAALAAFNEFNEDVRKAKLATAERKKKNNVKSKI